MNPLQAKLIASTLCLLVLCIILIVKIILSIKKLTDLRIERMNILINSHSEILSAISNRVGELYGNKMQIPQ